MDFFNWLVIPIVLLCLITGFVIKHLISDEKVENKWIPVIVTLEGMIAGVILCFSSGDAVSANEILNAIVDGGISGAASTGLQSAFQAFINNAGKIVQTDDNTKTTN